MNARRWRRGPRFAARRLGSGIHGTWYERLRRRQGLGIRLGLCLVAAVLTVAAGAGWRPPFPHRLGYRPQRDLRVRTTFSEIDHVASQRAREEAAARVPAVFVHNPQPLRDLPDRLDSDLEILAQSAAPDQLINKLRQAFEPSPSKEPKPVDSPGPDAEFAAFRLVVANAETRRELRQAVERALAPLVEQGLLAAAPSEPAREDVVAIAQASAPEAELREVPVRAELLLDQQRHSDGPLAKSLNLPMESDGVRRRLIHWLAHNLSATLTLDRDATQTRQQLAQENVQLVTEVHQPGDPLVQQGTPITLQDLGVLGLEHRQFVAQMSVWQKLSRFGVSLGLVLVLFALCGLHILRNEPEIAQSLVRLSVLLGLVVTTVAGGVGLNATSFYGESIPLVAAAMVLTIAYSLEFGLLVCFALALILAEAIGGDLGRFMVLVGTSATAVLTVGRVRSRRKLTTVGFFAGVASFALTWGTGILQEQDATYLLGESFRNLLWGFAAGLMVSGLLPFVERAFEVVTDLSLLELADVAQPLLHQLIQRAPGTYNHSITVATLAERAAEQIGANGLLVRVGAYFHDIGKMLKPQYFIENQTDVNHHDRLAPAMSTLIIIGHVKDGADLAKEHRLPQPIIDFIEQHHGTTLVEYFYHDATQQQTELGYSNGVEESSFRYPGPKPQTKEAGILMLADRVEGASRSLSEPTPARIERLVHQLAMKLLLDGQFDESGLDLQDLHSVEESLVKSVTAIYHARIKYPEPLTAS